MRRLVVAIAIAMTSGMTAAPAVGPVAAQEVMEFQPVPAESVSQLVRPAPRRRAARSATTQAPAAPEAPEAPESPAVPDRYHDRSGDVVRFGSDIRIPAGQTVAGDVVALGGSVTVDGHVEGEVVAIGGDVFLGPSARVDGQVVTMGGQLHERPGAHVGGQRVSAGGIPRGWFPWPFLGVLGVVGSGVKAAVTIFKMLLLLLVAWGFTQLAPRRTETAFEAVRREPLKCLGIGLLAWVLIFPSLVALALVAIILCITIIGIPLAIAVILGYALALLLLVIWGYVVGAAVLGERLARQLGRTAGSLTLMAVWGIVALTVIRVVGQLFGGLPMGAPAGHMLSLLATVLTGALVTLGAGALLWTQLRRDALGRLWAGRPPHEPAPAAAAPPGAPPPADPSAAPQTPPAPPPPPAGPYTPPPDTPSG